MKKRLTMILAGLFLGLGVAMAQTQVSGTVVSDEDGEPVIGASVLILGTKTGTITNVDGEFHVTMPANSTMLQVSYIGMNTQQVLAKDGMKVTLKSDSKTTLGDVVVTAMGIKRSEKALGYSATAINGDEIADKRTNDVMSALAGKVAGVQISGTSSDPGASNSVVIRGFSSLNGSNQPLYVVDGVPMDNTSTYSADGLNNGFDFGNGANAINPDDVASMTILKGAAATALYGSRAAAGVILVTTKSGSKHAKGLGVEYNGGLQWKTVARLPQMQNEFGMGWYGDKTVDENGSWGPALNGSMQLFGPVYENSQLLKPFIAQPDNIRDFFDTGFQYSNSISFNGASDTGNFFASMSQIHDDGIIPTDADSYKKYTFSLRASQKLGDKLTISTALNYAFQGNSFATTGQGLSMYNSILQSPRDINMVSLKDLNNIFNTPGYYYTPYGITNPYYILENYENKYEAETFYGKLQLDYDITKDLKFMYRFSLDTSTGQINMGQPNMSKLFFNTPNYANNFETETGMVREQIIRRREINQDVLLTYNKTFGDFNLNALAGFNGNERKVSYLDNSITNLTVPNWFDLTNTVGIPLVNNLNDDPTSPIRLRRLMGVLGEVDLSWKDMVYFTVSARNDWSSTLPEQNNSFFYPGITGSWVFSEVLPASLKKIITFGKVRAAWGKTGNDASPYMVYPVYSKDQVSPTNGFGHGSNLPLSGINGFTLGNTLASTTLSPEMTTELEFGLNMAFFDNRLSFDAAYYDRSSDKQIFTLDADAASGYTGKVTNLGKIRNRGIELLVSGTPIKTKDFSWDISWNFTKNNSKVIELPPELGGRALLNGLVGGVSMYAITGKEVGTFEDYVPQRDPQGNMIVDAKTGLPVPTSDTQVIGSMNYKYTMGISTSLHYKGITLSADLDIRHGGLMYSNTKALTYFTGNAIQTAYNNRNPFIIPNSVNAVTGDDGSVTYVENTTPLDPTTIYQYWNDGGSGLDSAFLIDKSYVKLRTLSLSWELPTRWLARTPLTGITLSAFGNNLFLWTPNSNTFIDPEMSSFGNDLEGQFGEWAANPSSRTFGFNVNIKF